MWWGVIIRARSICDGSFNTQGGGLRYAGPPYELRVPA